MRDVLKPMLASLADAPLVDPDLVYEPKYDGIRCIVEVDSSHGVRLWSRLGNDKTQQFPEIVKALVEWARQHRDPVVLDGEIVALDRRGQPIGFQHLQGRIHEKEQRAGHVPVGFVAFDLLRAGRIDWRSRPLTERRAELERLLKRAAPPLVRISEIARGDGRPLYRRAMASGWEGLIAKLATSTYASGKRTPAWRKLKIVHEQELVVGGWTEPRQTRAHFGALLLGVYEDGVLVYAGHTGTGFSDRELERVMKALKPLETRTCPFATRPKTNERPHWVEPKLVAQIKFTEWTADGNLRHPVYLGLRDDKRPTDVRREKKVPLHRTSSRLTSTQATSKGSIERHSKRSADASGGRVIVGAATDSLIEELRDLEQRRSDGMLVLPDGDRLSVTSLHKVFWPKLKLTKGDLFRYYVAVAPFLLPAIQDRALVMKRYPNGLAGSAFYQQRAPDAPPPGVRFEAVSSDSLPARLVGGNLTTLLYMTQLAAISQDPWFSRVQSPLSPDYVALDLDPAPGVSFDVVLDVARWIRDELGALGAPSVPKTSGADGLHVFVPLPPDTPYEAGLIACQIVAAVVVRKHAKAATVERKVAGRGSRVYVDCLQNIHGKTLASAYSARASEYAGVSMPLTWEEIDAGVRREDFTIVTAPAHLRAVGDRWASLRKAKGIDLSRIARYAERSAKDE